MSDEATKPRCFSGGAGLGSKLVLSKGNDGSGIESDHNVFLNGVLGFPEADGNSIVHEAATDTTLGERRGTWRLKMDLPDAVLASALRRSRR